MQQLLRQQLKLEEESICYSTKKYFENEERGSATLIINKALRSFVDAIEAYKVSPLRSTKHGKAKRFLKSIPSEVLAHATLKQCIASDGGSMSLQNSSLKLFTLLSDYLEYQKFFRDKSKRGYLKTIEMNLKSVRDGKRRKKVLGRAKRYTGIEDTKHDATLKIIVANKLYNLLIESTGIVELVPATRNTLTRIVLVPQVIAKLQELDECLSLLQPRFIPMVVPPRDWVNDADGGFLSPVMVSTRRFIKQSAKVKEQTTGNEAVRTIINNLQQVSYKINKELLGTMSTMFHAHMGLAGLPLAEPLPLPSKLWNNDKEFEKFKLEHPEELKSWKLETAKVHTLENDRKAKAIAYTQIEYIAGIVKDFEKIYFVWSLDFRGRIYPVANYINPQGDDVGKSLLLYADGKPLGDNGLYWLKVHCANCFGVDKVSFDERVKWVNENISNIIDSAKTPLDYLWWADADKPFCFLAVCNELERYSREGSAFLSYVPVAMDGSNNGLQHLAAMAKDSEEGRAVNLLPNDQPQDIYAEVAQIVIRLNQDNLKGANSSSYKCKAETLRLIQNKKYAEIWLGNINRSACKRAVMTTPYGVSEYGIKDQVSDYVSKKLPNLTSSRQDSFGASNYLGKLLIEALSLNIQKSKDVMEWLQETVRVIFKEGHNKPLRWTTPVGLRVVQGYAKTEMKRYRTYYGDLIVRLSLIQHVKKGALNQARSIQAISPNFVHSMDASHLMLTAKRCLKEGMNFTPIHDSFGTHACDVDRMNIILREEFVKIYSEDVLAKFQKEIIAQLPEHIVEKLPSLPEYGNLDISSVLNSRYFFA